MMDVSLKQEDAINIIVEWIRGGCKTPYGTYGYEVYLPALISELKLSHEDELEQSPVFFDAAWELCRRGILRPGVRHVGAHATADGGSGSGFCLTAFGKTWMAEDDHTFVPTEPERFAALTEPFKHRFGPGYFERAQQAIRCYGAHAYLACCAMCGAAAESILLATAIAKVGNADEVLRMYRPKDGRTRVENLVVGKATENLRREFLGLTSLLKYWRDEAAHGQSSQIDDNEAYTSLVLLIRTSIFVDRNWNEFTKTD